MITALRLDTIRSVLDSAAERLRSRISARPDRGELYDWYREHPLARRLASVIPQDAIRRWSLEVGDEQIDAPEGDHEALLEAAISARVSGGAWLWPYIEGDQSTPLADGPYDIRAVHVVTRSEAIPESWDGDLASPTLGRPLTLRIQLHRDQAQIPAATVHRSRLIYIPGIRAQPDEDTGSDGYDLSVRDVYGLHLDGYRRAWHAGSQLVERLSMPAYHMRSQDPAVAADPGYESALRSLRRSMVAAGLIVLFNDDQITWSGPSLNGFADVTDEQWRAICAEEGIPRTRLLGEQTTGLSSSDIPGQQLYDDLLSRLQLHDYEPAIRRLMQLRMGPLPELSIEWEPMRRLDPMEEAQRSLTLAQRDATLAGIGTLLDVEIRDRIRGGEDRLLPPMDDAAWQASDIGVIDERDGP